MGRLTSLAQQHRNVWNAARALYTRAQQRYPRSCRKSLRGTASCTCSPAGQKLQNRSTRPENHAYAMYTMGSMGGSVPTKPQHQTPTRLYLDRFVIPSNITCAWMTSPNCEKCFLIPSARTGHQTSKSLQ